MIHYRLKGTYIIQFPSAEPDRLVYVYNPNIQEAEAGGLKVQSEFQANPGYIMRPFFSKNKK